MEPTTQPGGLIVEDIDEDRLSVIDPVVEDWVIDVPLHTHLSTEEDGGKGLPPLQVNKALAAVMMVRICLQRRTITNTRRHILLDPHYLSHIPAFTYPQ